MISEWAHANDLELTWNVATLAITTEPAHAAGAAWVHSPFAGVEHLAPTLPDHVLLTRTTGTMPQRIAEYVLAWVLTERWQTARYVADSATATWDPSDPPAPPALDGPGADVIVLALPHTPQTAGLITPELLRAFDGVHLVNVGRGSAIRTDTLLDAIATGHVRHATLDVTEQEPLGASSPLWRRPEITVTPHVSGLTLPSDVVAGLDAALREIRAGVRPRSAVAPDRGYRALIHRGGSCSLGGGCSRFAGGVWA